MAFNQLGSIDLGPLDDGLQDLGLPVPVQTFLWGQIAPFIRPKLGKLHEATCMFCQHAPGHHVSILLSIFNTFLFIFEKLANKLLGKAIHKIFLL
ncbi:Protein unc-80 like [Pseudolycoriella hygida]|uniref:Protein unc-80 like n=1 Tax=Pseudolycoriella hygida TaxID=35572 RepID=A0A9Q0RYE5_9DIPT|nr:Protein unc-80 like [Pseudolycoriella hygida]